MANSTYNNCCINCFDIDEINDFIQSYETKGICDYCYDKTAENFVAPVDEVGEYIRECFFKKYEDAAEHVPYESAEGGYQFNTEDIHEILYWNEQILKEENCDFETLREDLIENDGTPYVRKNILGRASGGLDEIDSWNSFCEFIIKQQRYTSFWQINQNYTNTKPHEYFINSIISFFFDETLTQLIYKGKIIYRARLYDDTFKLNNENMTSPPLDKTINNRMSPKGISLFYGSFDENTSIYEIRPSVDEKVVVSEFIVNNHLLILDLSLDLDFPINVFNEEYSFHYEEFIRPFLVHFINDIAKPITTKDSDTDYIPTQAFTEFIRYHVKDKFDGIAFKSSLNENGKNVVLFKGPEISLSKVSDDNWLQYSKSKIIKIKSSILDFEDLK